MYDEKNDGQDGDDDLSVDPDPDETGTERADTMDKEDSDDQHNNADDDCTPTGVVMSADGIIDSIGGVDDGSNQTDDSSDPGSGPEGTPTATLGQHALLV